MNTRIESMSHGDGKVYLQMVLDRISPDAEVILSARLKDGTKIPAHLFPFVPIDPASSANYVVVMPRFDVREVDLEFMEHAQDTPLSRSRLTVEMNMMSWRTRFNSFAHNELLSQMYDIEREYSANRMNIYFTDAIDDGEEIVVKMLVDMPNVDGADVMVDFADKWGNEIDLPVYSLLDEVYQPERFGDAERLRIGFSVRVQSSALDFCAIVYDANDLIAGGFAHFCDETYESLQDNFAQTMLDAASVDGYEAWYRHHCETLAGLALQREKTFAFQPLISLVLPVFAYDACYLPATLRALEQQTYSFFELIVVDCGLDEPSYDHAFRDWADDSRLTHITASADLDDASARLTGLLQSSGEVCAVLDPRIILAPEALFEYVRLINERRVQQGANASSTDEAVIKINPIPCEMVYANHDFFDREAGFHDPQFKPAFSPDLLYSYFYMGPLVFMARSVVDDISRHEGFSTDAFDYDLALKASQKARGIERIDQVLYHVQDAACISAEANAVGARREEEAFRLGRKVLALHLRRQKIDAVVLSEISDRIYRVKYRLPDPRPALSIIIPIKDEVELLDTCLSSLVEHDTLDGCELVIVDNASTDPETLSYLADLDTKLAHVRVVKYDAPFNPAAIANAAASGCTSDYLLFLDDDTEVITTNAVSTLLAHCMRPDVAVVAPKLLYPDDTIQHAGMMVGAYGTAGNVGVNCSRNAVGYMRRFSCTSNLSAVSSAVMMVKRAVFEEVGGFDERFKVSCHDVDFCLKVNKAGYRVAYNGGVEFYHQENATTGHALTAEQVMRAERERAFLHYRWPECFIKGDPYFSACLDGDSPYFRLS